MKKILLILLITHFFCFSWAQLKVSASEADIILDSRKMLFCGYKNLVTVIDGKQSDLSISAINASISKTKFPGKYYIQPNCKSQTATIILKGKNYKKSFEFSIFSLPDPEVDFWGQKNEDGMIVSFRETRGIRIRDNPNDLYRQFRIDSFTITFKDSVNEIKHKNTGYAWDSKTDSLIQHARHGTTIVIDEIYVWLNGIERQLYSRPTVYWIK